jgi:hypothetical protein
MNRHWTFFGFVSILFTPIIAFELSLAFGTGVFTPFKLAILYPLTLVLLVASPLAFRPGSYESPKAGLEFSKGARYGLWTTTVIAFPLALTFGLVYNQLLLGFSILLVAFGSTSLSDISVSATCGYLLAKGEGVNEFFARANKWVMNREMRIIFWLSIILRRFEVSKRISITGNFAAIPYSIYFLGWGLFSIAGGFPATLFGVSLGILVPVCSDIALRRRLTKEDKEKLIGLLVNGTSESFRHKNSSVT